ncbi:MAG: lipase family protein [Myxococcota bacterium]
MSSPLLLAASLLLLTTPLFACEGVDPAGADPDAGDTTDDRGTVDEDGAAQDASLPDTSEDGTTEPDAAAQDADDAGDTTDDGGPQEADATPDVPEDAGLEDVTSHDGGDAEDDADAHADAVDGEDAPEPYEPPFDPTVCGAEPHTWLPPQDVGGVVIWEEMLLSGLSPEDVDNLLIEAGLEEATPVPYGVRNFKLRYVTQDRGELREATAIVGVPTGIETGAPRPTALWLHGTSGFSDDCAPSINDLEGAAPTALLAAFGYFTIAPDYVGMLGFGEPSEPGTIHPYLVGESVALSSLDAVRAALNGVEEADEEDLVAGDPERLVLLGGSQGGHATFFAELYAPYYAPELDVVAAAAAVPVTDVVDHGTYGAQVWGPTGMTLSPVLVAMRAWYGAPESLEGVLTNTEPHYFAETIPELMASTCSPKKSFDDVDSLEDLYPADFLETAAAGGWEDLQPWGCYLEENSVGRTSVPRITDTPFLATFGELDDLVITELERKDIARLCEDGYRIEYLECAGEGHTGGAVASLPYMLAWVADRVAGEPWPEDEACTIDAPVECEFDLGDVVAP